MGSAPGFITGQTDMKVDASTAIGGDLVMKIRSTTPEYTGFKVSFAASSPIATLACASGGAAGALSRGCFKAPFQLSAGDDFQEVRIPLSDFSDKWSSATGELTTLCKDDADVCPSASRLKKVQRVSIWGKGALGKVHVEVDSVSIEPAALSASASAALVTFDGAKESSFSFRALDDPVMGGKSTGTWTLGAGDGSFRDISDFIDGSLVLSVRSTTPEYTGYRVTFTSGALSADFACAGGGSLPFSRGCYKNKFSVPVGSEFVDVKIPFNTFSDKWSSATGEQTVTCADDDDVCPTASKLSKIQRIEFWGEGALGKLHLEIESVSAESASGERFQLV